MRKGTRGRAGLRRFIDALLLLLSPLMVIGFLIAVIMLVSNYGEHRRFVRNLEASGRVATAVVKSASPDYGWAFVTFEDAHGEARTNVLEMQYYPDETWEAVTPKAHVMIRYLPYALRNSDRVVLEDRFEDVQSSHAFLSGDMVGLLITCWLVVIIKPHILYAGLIDADVLMEKGFRP